MRVAVWAPLDDRSSEAAREARVLLEQLRRFAELVVVVRDADVRAAIAPRDVPVVASSDYRPVDVDVDVYHMADDALGHGYMHGRALARPGLLVLHDLSLVELYLRLGGGSQGTVFREEMTFDANAHDSRGAAEPGDGHRTAEPSLYMTRRLVEASLVTVVHSSFAARELSTRSPGSEVVYLPPAVEALATIARRPDAPLVFGVDGAALPPGGLSTLVEALAIVERRRPGVRLLVANEHDLCLRGRQVAEMARAWGVPGAVAFAPGAPGRSGRDDVVRAADVVLELGRHPAGGSSSLVLVALSSGRVVIARDGPQLDGYDESYCRRLRGEGPVDARTLAAEMLALAMVPESARESGRHARDVVGRTTEPRSVAAAHLALLRRLAPVNARREGRRALAARHDEQVAVNAIGSWEATTGLTEAARRCVGALVASGVGVAMDDVDYGAPRLAHRFPAQLRELPRGRPYGVDLCFLNVNEIHTLSDAYLRPEGRRRHLVAYWYWELTALPRFLRPQLARVDEIWVASEFVAQVFRRYASTPVHVVPCVVEPSPDAGISREDFGLPPDACIFFFNFDANSTVARKNPRAVISAFRRAFTAEERAREVHLVMKTINLAGLVEARSMLEAEMRRVGGTIVDDDLTPGEVAALTEMSDVYVSLHRAEGFGLGIAEAMYLAKPVVATGYSGNMDVMSISNSCPVGYRMVPVDAGELRFNRGAERVYPPGEWWADADVADAARWMRRLYESPATRARLGASASLAVRDTCSTSAVGRRARELLAGSGVRC